MDTNSDKELLGIISFDSDNDKIEFEKDILHFMFMNHISEHMHGMKYSSLAKEMEVSTSFISQLFSGDKTVSLEFLAKVQRVLKFKFQVDSVAINEEQETNDNDNKIIKMMSFSDSTNWDTSKYKRFITNGTEVING